MEVCIAKTIPFQHEGALHSPVITFSIQY